MRPRRFLTPFERHAVLLVLVMILASSSTSGFGTPPDASERAANSIPTSAVAPSIIHPASPPNGNLSLSVLQPSDVMIPGMYIQDELSVTVQRATGVPLPSPLTVWVPQTISLYRTSNGTLQVINPALTLNFTTGQTPDPSALVNASTVVKLTGAFNSSTPALLTSQLLAFMTNAPYGSLTLAVSWKWTLAYPDGSTSSGAWSPAAAVVPAQYAQLVSYGPTELPVHGSFHVCMEGSTVTREFSLHLETISPVDDFIQVEQNVTANSTTPTCWSAQVATWVAPQPILAHVWEYGEKTFLLYLIKVTVVDSTTQSSYLSPLNQWNVVATVISLGAAAGLIVWVIRKHLEVPP
jgi:hypothetical protein